MLLALPLAAATTVAPLAGIHNTNGGATSGAGSLRYCGHAMTSTTTGWGCNAATTVGAAGSARGWVQLQGNTQIRNLSGSHYFWEVGSLNLAHGYARLALWCPSGSSAYARVYVFWHVWVYDETAGSYTDQLNSGYIWDSGYVYCPAGGGSQVVYSPKMVGGFNSSTLGHYRTGFVASHTYLVTGFLGCAADAEVLTAPSHGTVAVGAFCNIASSASSSTFTLTSVYFR